MAFMNLNGRLHQSCQGCEVPHTSDKIYTMGTVGS